MERNIRYFFTGFQVVANEFLCPNHALLTIVENKTAYSMPINSTNNNISFTVGSLDTEKWLTVTARIVDVNAATTLGESQINICKSEHVFTIK